METIKTIVQRDATRLVQSLNRSLADAKMEIRMLLECVLDVNRAWLFVHEDETLENSSARKYEAMLQRRLSGEPIAYILGKREFYGRDFKVGPGVLIPRPETELLVDLAKKRIPEIGPSQVLDLGTGSGCIAISLALERPACRVTGVDVSQVSLNIAKDNAVALGARIAWQTGNWFEGLGNRKFDLIVSNPPYIADNDWHLTSGDVRFEPRAALAAGPEGMDDLARIISQAPTYLNAGGWLLLEHGWDQGPKTAGMLKMHGFDDVETVKDYAGHDRITLGKCR